MTGRSGTPVPVGTRVHVYAGAPSSPQWFTRAGDPVGTFMRDATGGIAMSATGVVVEAGPYLSTVEIQQDGQTWTAHVGTAWLGVPGEESDGYQLYKVLPGGIQGVACYPSLHWAMHHSTGCSFLLWAREADGGRQWHSLDGQWLIATTTYIEPPITDQQES